MVPGVTSARYTSLRSVSLNTGQHLFWEGSFAGPGVGVAASTALFEMSNVAGGPQMILRSGQRIMVDGQLVTLRSFAALNILNTAFGDQSVVGMAGYNSGRLDGGATVPVRLLLADGRTALAAAGADLPLTPVAVTRDAVPGISHAVWSTLGNPVAAPSGLLAFRGTLAPTPGFAGIVPAGTAQVLFAESFNGAGEIRTPALLARQGDAAPELPGLRYGGFSDPFLNRHGDSMYFSLLTGPGVTAANRVALFWRPAGETTARLVARTGSAAAGINGAEIATFAGAALPASFEPGEPTGPVFTTTLRNAPGAQAVSTGTNSALWAVDGAGAVRLLARTGSVVNGKTLRTIAAFRFVPDVPQQARAAAVSPHVICLATYTDQTQAIVLVDVPQ